MIHILDTDLVRKTFPALTEIDLRNEIAEVGKLMHFKAGEVIMNYGSYVKMVPLVVEGSIKVSREDPDDAGELLLYFLTAGETCSMSFTCCMTDKKAAIRTEAEEDTTIIGIPIQYVDIWMSKFSSWKNFVMRSYDDRMLELVKVIDNISFSKLDERMEHYLKTLADSHGSRNIQRTHKEIAEDLNASREAVSRLLKKMETGGLVKLGRNEIQYLGRD